MKKIVIALAAAAVLAGCQKPEVECPVESNEVFTASVEDFGAQTKTALAPGNHVVWSAGDHLAIFQGSTLANEYEITESSAGKANATFTRVMSSGNDFYAGTELPCNVAFYPYAEGLSLEGDMSADGKKAYTISTVLLPSVQMYEENSFANDAFPMVAVTQATEDHNLNFKNVLGALKLQLKGTQTVKSIKVEGANGEKLSGAATVTAYANNLAPVIKMMGSDDDCKTVTLDCDDGVQLSESEATNFYVALPPVLFEKGFTVTVTDVEENVQIITAEAANTVLRSSILVMPEITVETEEVENPEGGSGDSVNDGDYVDEYGINHGPGVEINGVVWAPVNCGYHATDYQWGKLYQWGRKYGQGYSGNLLDGDYKVIGQISDATIPEISQGRVSLEIGQSENNKNVFYEVPSYDWITPQESKLWNSGMEDSPIKTEYDPCPEGWRVPTFAEFDKLCQNIPISVVDAAGQSGYSYTVTSIYTDDFFQVFFPAAGVRFSRDSDARNRGLVGYYWSSKSFEQYRDGDTWIIDGANFLVMHDDVRIGGLNRACGMSVRCVKDVSITTSPEVPGEEVIPVSEVKLNLTSIVLFEEEFAQLTAKVLPVDAIKKKVVWTSQNPSVADVDQTGKVTARSAGVINIYAQAGNVVSICSVEVKQKLIATDYVDEYGVNHGKGVAIGMAVWAPVNCGYHATDYPYGKLYQWGRKYGQGYDSNDTTTPELSEGGVSLQGGQSESNKNVFFISSSEINRDWLYPQDAKIWNSGTEDSPIRTEYDPCPTGWRIPTYMELDQLLVNHSSWTTNSDGQNGYWLSGMTMYSESVSQVFFPASGYRKYSGEVDFRGNNGRYWSSKTSTYKDSYFLVLNDTGVDMSDYYYGYRAFGYSVRCVKE